MKCKGSPSLSKPVQGFLFAGPRIVAKPDPL